MSNDEERAVVSEIENAKKSDGTSTAGEHSVDQVNPVETPKETGEEKQADEDVKPTETKRDPPKNEDKTKVIDEPQSEELNIV